MARVSSLVMISALLCAGLVVGCANQPRTPAKAEVTRAALPPMAWDHRPGSAAWARAGLKAMRSHGRPLLNTVPTDIDRYCPGYPRRGEADRAAFWVGLLSALAKYESTWNPQAVGGNGRWFGLVQIAPATARGYECKARSGAELTDGGANISCAIRIAAAQVPRDNRVSGGAKSPAGLSRDWTPFRDSAKRSEIARWTRAQPYCR